MDSSEGFYHLLVDNFQLYGNYILKLLLRNRYNFLVLLTLAFVLVLYFRRRAKERDVDPVYYTCLYIDATFDHMRSVLRNFRRGWKTHDSERIKRRDSMLESIRETWTKSDKNPVLTCLSVKTGLDLFLRVQKYPPNHEIIMTAVNNPDLAKVIVHHGLKVVPLDIDYQTLSCKGQTLSDLVNEKTVAILFSHLFGRTADITDAINLAHNNGIHVLEVCSQAYRGPGSGGESESDLVFFSFEVIEPCTAFGGAIVRVKDNMLFNKMTKLHESYPIHDDWEYIKFVLRNFVAGLILKSRCLIRLGIKVGGVLGYDVETKIKQLLTDGDKHGMIRKLREQPPHSMLHLLNERFSNFSEDDFNDTLRISEYVCERLPPTAVQIGTKTRIRGFWLFPIIVDDPVNVIKHLNNLGINAAHSVTNIQVIGSRQSFDIEKAMESDDPLTFGLGVIETPPSGALYMMDHMIYLPVHKHVTQYDLDQICLALEIVLNKLAILKKYRSSLTVHGPYGPILSRHNRSNSKRKSVKFSPTVTVRSSQSTQCDREISHAPSTSPLSAPENMP